METAPFHIGEYIQDELDERGWTIETLIEKSGLKRERLEPILKLKSVGTTLDAFGLATAFGTGVKVWIDLQNRSIGGF